MKINEWNEEGPRKAGFKASNCDDSSVWESRSFSVRQNIMATKLLAPPNTTRASVPGQIPLGQKSVS